MRPRFASERQGNRRPRPQLVGRDSRNLTKPWSAPAQDSCAARVGSMAPSGVAVRQRPGGVEKVYSAKG